MNDETYAVVNAPSDMPEPNLFKHIEEPFVKASIITASDYVGPVLQLCMEKRGQIKNHGLNSGKCSRIHMKCKDTIIK